MTLNFKNILTLGKGLLLRRRVPLFVTFRITTRCNMKCRYCDSIQCRTEEMNTEQILNMIDELRELGMVKFGITGGEPLLREDIGEIIDHAQQKGVIVTLNTNGSFVPKRIEDLLGLHTLIVSIDGLEKTHEINRLRGSFASAMQAIKTARDRALNVWSLTVISKDNVSELDELIDLMRSMRVRMLFQPVEEWDIHSDAVSESLPSKQEFRRTIDKLISLKKKDKIIATSMSYLKLLHSWPIYPGFARCDVGRFSCNIMPNGDVISLKGRHNWRIG